MGGKIDEELKMDMPILRKKTSWNTASLNVEANIQDSAFDSKAYIARLPIIKK